MGEAAAQIKKKVLAVDDEEEILRLYTTFLEYRGYEVIAVNNAAECLAFLNSEFADIMLLDVNMPGIDGLKLLEMIKSDERLKDMRVVMVSARRDEDTVREASRLGCDGYVVKPFKLKELGERIGLELFAVDDQDLRAIFKGTLHVKTSLLREPGLADYDPVHWDSYPVKYKDVELCLLIPRGVRPARFARALTDDMEKRVLVFFKHPQKWKRIWPMKDSSS